VRTLSGWVNNAAVFKDAKVHTDGSRGVLETIALNARQPMWMFRSLRMVGRSERGWMAMKAAKKE
jgi:hypothetical protein